MIRRRGCWLAFALASVFLAACIPPANGIHFDTALMFVAPHPARSPSRASSSRSAKKKAGSPGSSKKIQVKLLKHIAGTGQAGQIVMVTPAFYNNKLRPQKAAEKISDAKVKQEEQDAIQKEKETRASALEMKDKLDTLTLAIKRKAGPNGQLFGGIGAKNLMEELHATIDDSFLQSKSVKITALSDLEGKKMKGDIKHTGEYSASVSLIKDVSATVSVVVEAAS